MPDRPKPPHSPSLCFDWRDWLPYLEDDVPEDQKQALIETLWTIVLAFADLGFDVTSEPETCGQVIDLKAALEAAVVSSDEAIAHQEKEDA